MTPSCRPSLQWRNPQRCPNPHSPRGCRYRKTMKTAWIRCSHRRVRGLPLTLLRMIPSCGKGRCSLIATQRSRISFTGKMGMMISRFTEVIRPLPSSISPFGLQGNAPCSLCFAPSMKVCINFAIWFERGFHTLAPHLLLPIFIHCFCIEAVVIIVALHLVRIFLKTVETIGQRQCQFLHGNIFFS